MMNASPQLTVLFDGSCSLCRASVARVRLFDRRGRIEFLSLHDPSAMHRFPSIDREEAMRSMQAVDKQLRVYTGADAWAQIGLRLPGWNLLAWILLVPGVRWMARLIYGWVARNRYRWNRGVCADGSCTLHLPASTDPAAKP
jgi:predicted DCC family thiol-disulfide oxidoreductase YuxK